MTKEVIIVVPCFNEERRLQIKVFEQYMDENPHVQFLFVDDGSRDSTFQKISTCKNVLFLKLERNSGKAEAVRSGIIKALSLNPTYVGYWDADLATPLKEINSLLFYDKKYKVRMCSRVKRLGGNVKRRPSRHIFGRVFATIVSLMLSLPVYDSQCGAKLFQKDIAIKIFREKFVSKWFFDVEILFRVKREGFSNHTLIEHPVSEWIVQKGSKLSFLDFLKTPFELLRIYIKYC